MEKERKKTGLAVPSRRCRSSQYKDCLHKWPYFCGRREFCTNSEPSLGTDTERHVLWMSLSDKTPHQDCFYVFIHGFPMYKPAWCWHLHFNTELSNLVVHTSLVTCSALQLNTFFVLFLCWNTAFHFAHPPSQMQGNKRSITKSLQTTGEPSEERKVIPWANKCLNGYHTLNGSLCLSC